MKLYDYQQRIVDSEKHKPSHALFMDMGTGKTITSLALFHKSPTSKILVVCLVSKIHDWAQELREHTTLNPVVLNKGTKKNLELLKSADCIIVNYESLWRLGESLLKQINNEWFIIVDESHKIKNTQSKIGKYMRKLSGRTRHKCILTGTPQAKGYIDYYNQLSFVDILPYSERLFKEQYCIYDLEVFNGQPIKQLVGYKNTEELDRIIHDTCVFFKREEDVLAPTHIDVSIEKHKSYNRFLKERVFNDVLADSSGALRMGLRQLCSGFLREYDVSDNKQTWIRDFLESTEERIVIFYNFNRERDDLIKECVKQGRPYSVYDGATKDLSVFKTEESAVAICNYASASTGLNDLVLARVGVMYSPTDDYILFTQSKKRLDRIGQTRPPLIYYLITEKSVEQAIYKALDAGTNFDQSLFDRYLQTVVDNI